jgi:hypothetical protein
MILSSSILLAAGNLQTLSMMACSNDSLPMIFSKLGFRLRNILADIAKLLRPFD